jgi:hypothetical protein
MKKRNGVPKGFKHSWKYSDSTWNETKVKPGLWKIKFSSIKRKKGNPSKSYGNFKENFKIKWKIDAIQYATKISPNAYRTTMIGTKRPIAAGQGKLKSLYKKRRY